MESLVAERFWNCVGTAIDDSGRGRGLQRWNMTLGTTDFGEQHLAGLCAGSSGELNVARGSLGRAYEPCNAIYIRLTVRARLVVRLGDRIAQVGYLLGKQAIRDSDLIEIGIGGERKQARMLALPTEAANTRLARSLEDRYAQSQPTDPTTALLALLVGKRDQRGIIHRLDETASQRAEGDTQGTNRLGILYTLQNPDIRKSTARTNGSLIYQRAPRDDFGAVVNGDLRVLELAVRSFVPNSQLRYLARTPGHRALMALTAGLGVVERPQPARDDFERFELHLVALMRLRVDDTVAGVVETDGGFGDARRGSGLRAS